MTILIITITMVNWDCHFLHQLRCQQQFLSKCYLGSSHPQVSAQLLSAESSSRNAKRRCPWWFPCASWHSCTSQRGPYIISGWWFGTWLWFSPFSFWWWSNLTKSIIFQGVGLNHQLDILLWILSGSLHQTPEITAEITTSFRSRRNETWSSGKLCSQREVCQSRRSWWCWFFSLNNRSNDPTSPKFPKWRPFWPINWGHKTWHTAATR